MVLDSTHTCRVCCLQIRRHYTHPEKTSLASSSVPCHFEDFVNVGGGGGGGSSSSSSRRTPSSHSFVVVRERRRETKRRRTSKGERSTLAGT